MNSAWRFLLPLFGVWLLLYGSYALSRPPLPDGPATIHAEIGREMLARHDWKTFHVNGAPVASTSRALDWSIAASFRIFGVSDWAARLPGAVCVLLLSFVVFFLGRMLFGGNAAGLYAALIVVAWPGTFLATRELTDAPFLYLETALVVWALWYFLFLRPLVIGPAIAVTAAAALIVFFSGSWPGVALPLSMILGSWMVRGFVSPDRRVGILLRLWWWLAFAIAAWWLYPGERGGTALGGLAWIAPAALLLGGWMANWEVLVDPVTARRIALRVVALGVFVAGVAIFFAIHGPVSSRLGATSFLVTAGASRIPLLIFALAVVVGVFGFWFFARRNNLRVANCFLIGLAGGIIVACQAALVIDSPFVSSQILAEAIRPELDAGDLVVIDGKYSDASSLAFYLDRPVSLAAASPSSVNRSPTGSVKVQALWNGSARVFLWTHANKPLPVSGESFVIATSGGKEILSNQPNIGGASF